MIDVSQGLYLQESEGPNTEKDYTVREIGNREKKAPILSDYFESKSVAGSNLFRDFNKFKQDEKKKQERIKIQEILEKQKIEQHVTDKAAEEKRKLKEQLELQQIRDLIIQDSYFIAFFDSHNDAQGFALAPASLYLTDSSNNPNIKLTIIVSCIETEGRGRSCKGKLIEKFFTEIPIATKLSSLLNIIYHRYQKTVKIFKVLLILLSNEQSFIIFKRNMAKLSSMLDLFMHVQ